jgi:hypothetical protein
MAQRFAADDPMIRARLLAAMGLGPTPVAPEPLDAAAQADWDVIEVSGSKSHAAAIIKRVELAGPLAPVPQVKVPARGERRR